jgi:hypothetical protein
MTVSKPISDLEFCMQHAPSVIRDSANNDNGLVLVLVFSLRMVGKGDYPRKRHWRSCVSSISARPEFKSGGLAYY